MIDIYYAIWVVLSVFMFWKLFQFNKISKFVLWEKAFKKVSGRIPLEFEYRHPEDAQLIKSSKLFFGFEFFWTWMGIITSEWMVFLFMIGLNVIVFFSGKLYPLFGWINNILKILLITFLVINHFHLKLNLFEMIFN